MAELGLAVGLSYPVSLPFSLTATPLADAAHCAASACPPFKEGGLPLFGPLLWKGAWGRVSFQTMSSSLRLRRAL